ncbi:MAG: cytochrome ubiquinol oxidase subunit I, partial [Proteobacteria bacterium]|nr:cytochrome ubiquinol oxidase subunit I [Pseudomonadota bacterium]
TGLTGMPRRIYTYPAGMGWDLPNMIISVGAVVFAAGVMLTLWNLATSLKRGAPAGPNPWDAATLEWSVASPPPAYNFRRIPIVASRHPLWEGRLDHVTGRSVLESDIALEQGRKTLATTTLDAEADAILRMPADSLAPLLCTLALSVGFAGLLTHLWWLAAVGGALTFLATAVWLAPSAAPDPAEETARG